MCCCGEFEIGYCSPPFDSLFRTFSKPFTIVKIGTSSRFHASCGSTGSQSSPLKTMQHFNLLTQPSLSNLHLYTSRTRMTLSSDRGSSKNSAEFFHERFSPSFPTAAGIGGVCAADLETMLKGNRSKPASPTFRACSDSIATMPLVYLA